MVTHLHVIGPFGEGLDLLAAHPDRDCRAGPDHSVGFVPVRRNADVMRPRFYPECSVAIESLD
jgi:hypothetical protein